MKNKVLSESLYELGLRHYTGRPRTKEDVESETLLRALCNSLLLVSKEEAKQQVKVLERNYEEFVEHMLEVFEPFSRTCNIIQTIRNKYPELMKGE